MKKIRINIIHEKSQILTFDCYNQEKFYGMGLKV
jgi:hypothetical protein